MSMKLLYITNDVDVAAAADNAGVDEIFVDLEIKGKEARQSGRDTVISKHKVSDIADVKSVLKSASLLTRCNPVGDWTAEEVNRIIASGADVIMLPYFKKIDEVQFFLDCVAGRVATCLLVETRAALEKLDSILRVEGVERIHFGLNDLHIERQTNFMFEPFADGTLEDACRIARSYAVNFGIGGVAGIGSHLKPSPECILGEHKRLGSNAVILSRSFIDLSRMKDIDEMEASFSSGVSSVREWEKIVESWSSRMFEENQVAMQTEIRQISKKLAL